MIRWSLPVLLLLAFTLRATFAQDPVPALHQQVAAEYQEAEARLKSLEERLAGALDAPKRAEFEAVRQKWIAYRDASAAMTLTLIQPKAERAEYFRYLELNKLTRDRLNSLERIPVPAAQ